MNIALLRLVFIILVKYFNYNI